MIKVVCSNIGIASLTP
nr:hypothetical protein [Vibrio ordalii]